jgi:hypothetical protein
MRTRKDVEKLAKERYLGEEREKESKAFMEGFNASKSIRYECKDSDAVVEINEDKTKLFIYSKLEEPSEPKLEEPSEPKLEGPKEPKFEEPFEPKRKKVEGETTISVRDLYEALSVLT